MNEIAAAINKKLDGLRNDKRVLEAAIKSTVQDEDSVKSKLHQAELRSLVDATKTPDPSLGLVKDIIEIAHDKKLIGADEQKLTDLHRQLKELDKKIESYTFWARYADTDDPMKQAEAKRKIGV